MPTSDNRVNPYIANFIDALTEVGMEVTNPPHKNPLFSLLTQTGKSDYYIFHWLENVPDYKHGWLQFLAAIFLIGIVKMRGKKVVWFLHNKETHSSGKRRMKKALTRLICRKADCIITHASEGIQVTTDICPQAAGKTHFLHHPTKNRLGKGQVTHTPQYDLLVWGNISPYKGVKEFVAYCSEHTDPYRALIVGHCSDPQLWEELKSHCPDRIHLENRTLSFEELAQQIQQVRYVLIPYAPESILSSGILMDSLSFGAPVIGPEVGSFLDYAHEPQLCVRTFRSFDDIRQILEEPQPETDREAYAHFLEEHNWKQFAQKFKQILTNL